ncbi:type II secretion system secretin GspD [Diaphorobacter limosus]|uniref:Type II secretion system secretin GspD n=1 Tax=Diaphorobacter limosus TaxID=3036128 RepID=A0ABZ0J3C5_9BURK|nr:type II secretion system secretin GspD [Diaphorobacter sp. Y-1]WOO31841.1 type II secretion system secretin GspD [Diaphorobacter sp. Y-1]
MNIRPSILLLAMLAAGCASVNDRPASVEPATAAPLPAESGGSAPAVATAPPAEQAQPQPAAAPAPATAQDKAPEAKAAASNTKLFPGTGQLVKQGVAPKADPVLATGDRVSLNFENVTIGNLAAALLGDLLKLNYTIDAGGETVVSLRTRQPLLRAQVLDVLDAVLLPHDLAIVRDNAGVYHVTKRAATAGSRPLVSASKFKDLTGSGTVIVPLNHIAAAEMAKILAPLAPRESIVYVDTIRNLLVLQGSKAQLGGWLEMVDTFDVDFLSGMSLGVFVLENASVNVVRDALQVVLGGGGGAGAASAGGASAAFASAGAAARPGAAPAASSPAGAATANAAEVAEAAVGAPLFGLIRLFPVERLNALVVVTPRPHLLPQVETWIRRLDRPTDALEQQLFVYPVQNGSAVHLAEMLNGLFTGGQAASGAARPGVAAGAAPTQFGAAAGLGSSANRPVASTSGAMGTGASGTGNFGALGTSTGAAGQQGQLSSVSQLEGGVRVVADDKRNALLIRATRVEYRRIEQALRELDKAPTQVLIEASIVEVSLTGNLRYGVEWFIENSMSRDRTGQAGLNLNASGPIGAQQPGFSYTISKAGVVRATLNALAASSQLRVLSNPSVLVLDNHSATILVGRQQPIKQSTTVTTGNLVTEAIVYKDTGVMLSVTPSVNAGGLVTLDINQQVTDVGDVDAATGQRNFLTRQIQSRVAVRSGDPIVLGGVMTDNENGGNSGVPGLRNIPLLGALFSTTNNTRARTELLVMLTPRVLTDDSTLREVSAELRDRMRNLTTQTSLSPLPALEPGHQSAPAPALVAPR